MSAAVGIRPPGCGTPPTAMNCAHLLGHRGAVLSVAFSPDGQSIVTGSQDHQAKVWDATSGAVLHTLRGHGASVFSVGFSPDGKWIISGSDDQTARVWDAASGEELRAFKGHGSQIGSVAFSPDGQRIVTGGGAVRFSPDGRFVDSNVEDDPTAKVWDAGGGMEVLTLEGHTGAVMSVDFSADGRLVVSGSFDGTARVWDVRTGQGICWRKGARSSDPCGGFSPGRQAVRHRQFRRHRERLGRRQRQGTATSSKGTLLRFFLWPFLPTAGGLPRAVGTAE